jgi:site-specific DNA recombinase
MTAQAAGAFSADILTMEQLEVINSELRPQLKQAMADVATAGQPSVLRKFYGPGDTRQMWECLTLAERRRVVSRFDITINPTTHKGPGFDADAIKISWKKSAGNQSELTRSSALLVQHAAHTELGAWVFVPSAG